jgi:hypothetical protein
MSRQTNNGISAQNVTAQNIAVGSHAKIVQTNWLGEATGRLVELQREIESFQGPEPTRSELVLAHAEVSEELGAPEPDKSKVMAGLERIRRLAGPTTAVAQAALAVAQVIAAVL